MNKDNQNRTRVVIAGGGSAGWMAAAFLSDVFKLNEHQKYSITLVESNKIPPIGVGEATIHTMRGFLAACGVSEGDFMVSTDATLKHGILFKDWLFKSSEGESGHQYFHPFEGAITLAPEPIASHWLNAKLTNATSDRYDRWAGVQSVLAAASRSPKTLQSAAFEAPVNYGYHLDATKFADFLKTVSLKRGVTHIQADITDVATDSAGDITHLCIANGQNLEGDFFIDCTGFASLLSRATGGEFVDYSDYLLCDRAVTIRWPRPEASYQPRPFTTATARESGWTFEIDLQTRTGLGYIYSSRHCDEATAEEALRSFYPEIDSGLGANHLKMRIGRLSQSWNKNCVALGLSSGFLEPLESTGLYFIEIALRLLVDYWDPTSQSGASRKQFNDTFNSMFDEAMQFIVLHYILSTRRDSPFWRDVLDKTPELPELAHRLDLWQHKPPTDGDFRNDTVIFQSPNYAAILYGMERLPKHPPANIAHIPSTKSLEILGTMKKIQKMAVENSPTHADFIKKYIASFS